PVRTGAGGMRSSPVHRRDRRGSRMDPMSLPFARSAQSTLGLEWELALVDATDATLQPVADRVLASVADAAELHLGQEHPHVKPELLLNTVELVTDVCHTVSEGVGQLRESARAVQAVTDPMGID